MPSMPIVGDITLTAVQQMDHVLDAGFEATSVPGLDGDPLHRAGRGSHAIHIVGVLRGATASDDLSALQTAAAAGDEVAFAADITTALELQKVVVTDFRAREIAGFEQLVTYDFWLVESPPLPPPAEVSGGLGDLGFDTDIMDDLAGAADDLAGAVDAVMDAADQLQALAALASIDIGGPLRPLGETVDGLAGVASGFGSIAGALSGLLGDGT